MDFLGGKQKLSGFQIAYKNILYILYILQLKHVHSNITYFLEKYFFRQNQVQCILGAYEVMVPFFELLRPEAIILLVQDDGQNVCSISFWGKTGLQLGSLQSTCDEETRYG